MILSGRDVNARNGDRFLDTHGFVSFSLRAGKERRTKVLGLGRHRRGWGVCFGTIISLGELWDVSLESTSYACLLSLCSLRNADRIVLKYLLVALLWAGNRSAE